jgi:integrase
VYRNIAEKFREQAADLNIKTVTTADVRRWIANRERQSENVAYNFLKVMRGIMRAAIDLGLRDDDPTEGIRARPKDTGGYHTWTVDEVERFEARHPVGSKARRALALMLYLGVRRSDAVKLGRQHERLIDGEEFIKFAPTKQRRGKAPKELTLAILPELRRELDAGPSGELCYLVTEFGRPFTAAGFGGWFARRCREAGVPGRAHGLRKAGATLAAEGGATVKQLMAIYGWATAKEAIHYTEKADNKRMAADAMPLIAAGLKQQRKVSK